MPFLAKNSMIWFPFWPEITKQVVTESPKWYTPIQFYKTSPWDINVGIWNQTYVFIDVVKLKKASVIAFPVAVQVFVLCLTVVYHDDKIKSFIVHYNHFVNYSTTLRPKFICTLTTQDMQKSQYPACCYFHVESSRL